MNGRELGLRDKCRADFLYSILNGFEHQQECCDNVLTVKPLFRREAYVEGRLKVFLLLEGPDSSALSPVSANGLGNQRLASRYAKTENAGSLKASDSKESEIISDYLSDLSSSYNEMVLVAGVQGLDTVKVLVPTQIRLQRFDRVDDLFSGERCLSIADGTLKTLLAIGEGEENPLGIWGLVAHHAPSEDIECTLQVMDCITQNKRDFVGNGLMLLDEDFALVGALFHPTPEFEGAASKEGIASYFKIIDVLFGPFNLQTARLD